MRENILRAIHFGHAGKDFMLRETAHLVALLYREIVEKARNCVDWQQADKTSKCLKSQNEFGKTPKAIKPNEDFSLDFEGSLKKVKL